MSEEESKKAEGPLVSAAVILKEVSAKVCADLGKHHPDCDEVPVADPTLCSFRVGNHGDLVG